MTDSKIDRQHKLEQQSVADGITRYRNTQAKKDESDMRPGQALLSRTMAGLTDAIQSEKDKVGMARRGKPSVYSRYMAEFDADVMAYAVSRTVINALTIATPAKLNSLSIKIATSLQEAQLYSQLRPLEPNLFNAMERKAKKATTNRHARAVMNTAARVTQAKHGSVVGLEWTEGEKVIFGAKLVEIFITSTGLADLHITTRNRKSQRIVRGTPATLEWLERQHGNCELLTPIYMPMIVPPKDWTQPIGGGYLGQASMPSIPMIKTRDRDTIDELFSTNMPEVYNAINIIQRTPWKINAAVHDIMEELAAAETAVAGLPPVRSVEIPARPSDIDLNEEARKAWRASAAKAHAANARDNSKRIGLAQQLYIARTMRDEEELYFPHQLDFRGRLYPIPHGINPQMNDTGKALLQFAEGKPLGPSGAYWLAIHIANLYGFDKASLDDRVEWTQEHEKQILWSALDPLNTEWWMEADSPFCLLAACKEWAGYKMEGDSFVSHLPVAMDGSCSGLQHYSALLRDPIGGKAVNLVPSDSPVDIYTTVSERVTERLMSNRGEPLAGAWLGKVTRKIVKQPCMTYAYSATARGMRDQIVDAMRKMDPSGNYLPGWPEWEAANYLAPIVRQCIQETVVAATTAMDWLTGAIKELNKDKLPCIWTTPVGLPVIQREMEYKSKRVQLLFEGRRVMLNYAVTTKNLNKRKQISGIAPNYIHSMDSAHLMKTVNACDPLGMTAYAMVHDSFGTHACDVDELNAMIRTTFVDMYSYSWLQEFKGQSEALLGRELPPIPAMGDLELDLVEESDFFFS